MSAGNPDRGPTRFLVIANPIAGGGRGASRAPRLRDALLRRGYQAELFLTGSRGDGAARAQRVRPGEFAGIVAVGGDGTLHEVLGGLPETSTPLGVLAMGTANVLARELRLPRNPEALAEVLAAGRTRQVDIGLVHTKNARDRRFLLFVSSGLDASIVERVAEVRTGPQGMLRYLPTIFTIGCRWPVQSITATTADGEVLEGCSTVIATRVRGYAGIVRFPGISDPGDGMLHVLAFRQRSRWAYARALLRGTCGRLRPGRDVVCRTTTGVRITSDAAPWQVDGDLGGHGDVEIELAGAPVRLFVP